MRFFCILTTDRQKTDEQIDSTDALSRYRERRLNKTGMFLSHRVHVCVYVYILDELLRCNSFSYISEESGRRVTGCCCRYAADISVSDVSPVRELRLAVGARSAVTNRTVRPPDLHWL